MIYLYTINHSSEDIKNRIYSFLPILSEERKRKTERFVHAKDKANSILGEVLLRYILWKHYGIGFGEVSFTYGEHGKPLLAGRSDINFNISHSGNWILCGVSTSTLGVDVEEEKEESLQIAKRFFAEEEYEEMKGLPDKEQAQRFAKIWTLKESYVKCTGEGLSLPLNSFRFEIPDNTIRMYCKGILEDSYSFQCFMLDERYHGAVCVKSEVCYVWDDRVHGISLDSLVEWKEVYRKSGRDF